MARSRFIGRLIPALAMLLVQASARAVVVRDQGEFIRALENRAEIIEVEGVIEFERRYGATNNALPVVDFRVVEIRGRPGAELRSARRGYRLLEITGPGRVVMNDLLIRGFSTAAPGGAIRVEDADLWMDNVTFRSNHSGLVGGALHIRGPFPMVRSEASHFESNSAGERGGAINLAGVDGNVSFERSRFVDNAAPVGCAVSMVRTEGIGFSDSLFRGDCAQALMDAELGRQGFQLYRNTWVAAGGMAFRFALRAADQPMQTSLKGNIFVDAGASGKPLCRGDVAGNLEAPALRSSGTNVATDASCGLTHGTDRIVDEPERVLADVESAVPALNGPAMDVEPLSLLGSSVSPDQRCAVADANGLGRPQDGDGDGVPACDMGAVERQRGPDTGPWQTGAYFDPDRNGEGYFVEMLGDGRAWVTYFTYTPIGGSPPIRESYPEWFAGLGRVVGNSIVVSNFLSPKRGRFGEGFNREDLLYSNNAEFSMVFPGCEASVESPGTAYFRSGELSLADAPSHTDLFTRAVRLSRVVPCNGGSGHPLSGRSGHFHAAGRDGEGIQVQWLPDGRVLAAWFTFGLDGYQQLWMISESSKVEDDTVTLSMIYPAQTTAFGPHFTAGDVGLKPWGTVTLEYVDCDTIKLTYDSVVEGYGSGSHVYRRLTRPAGTACEP